MKMEKVMMRNTISNDVCLRKCKKEDCGGYITYQAGVRNTLGATINNNTGIARCTHCD